MHLPILLTSVDYVTVLVLFHVVMKYLLVPVVFVYEKKQNKRTTIKRKLLGVSINTCTTIINVTYEERTVR